MKNSFLFFSFVLMSIFAFGQAPQAFKYQALARDLNSEPVINQPISVKISILAGSPEGTLVYSELHQTTTNSMGLFTLEIGSPTQILYGNFADISWGTSSHFLKTAIDLTGSGEFQVLGVSQFLSVPYALYAGQTGDTTNWQKNQNVVYYNKGQVGIGTSQPDSSAKLDVNSNSQGFLPPRMTTEERDSIPNPAAGLIIFNTNTHCINFFNGSEWVEYGRDPMDTFECGQMFTDPRDKQQYQTVQIGEQCWFAENLNVGTKINASLNQTDNDVVEKYCYENVPANCSEYGGLYQWDEMMAYDTLENTKGICPEGWHLPNQAEWQTLFDAFGGAIAAGTELATTGTSGFDALMNGKFDAVAGFSGQNNLSTFWSSSGTLGAQATGYDFTSGSPVVNTSNGNVFNGYGVRCLKGLPNVTDPNMKVIDTLVYRLLSDSLEIVQGIYRYEIIGSRKAKDIITDENIVVGTEVDGYLRKVDEATIAGNEMTLTTSDATFENAFIEGEFNLNTGLTGKGKPVFTFTRVKYLATGVEISPQKDGFTYNFTNVVLYEDDNISVTVPQGHVKLNPEFNFDFKFKNRQVKRLLFAAENTVFENSLDVQLDVTGSINAEYEKTLAHIEKYIVFWAGPVPVVVVIKTKLIGKVGCSFDAEFMATTGYTNTNNISFGVKFEYGDWQKIWDLDSDTELHPINWNETISLNQYLKIIPQIDIMFYGVAGPYFKLPLWEELEANIIAPSFDSDASLDIGLDGNLGAKVTIFGETLADYSKDIFGFEHNLYKTPAKLEMVSGNNQTGNINTQLPLPLKVKVTDSQDWTYIPAQVHFSVESGGGSLTETDLWTDSDGFAQTYWTLGALAGEQTVKAEVLKADGEAISGSPKIFSASAQENNGQCGQTITINHIAGVVAPVTKTVTYGTVTNIPGETSKCWITSNLGADHQATTVDDATEASAGWYWQFNKKQGYKHDGTTRTPNSTWITNISDNSDWLTANDPCNIELGSGWRIPTNTEWTNVDASGNWTNWNGPWTSGLKLHNAGALSYNFGELYVRGLNGLYWSRTQRTTNSSYYLTFGNNYCNMSYDINGKSYAFPVRCINNEATTSQLEVTPQIQEVFAPSGTTTFEVTSYTTWAVEENNSWLSVSPTSGSGNGTITVTFDANPDTEPRNGQITIKAEGGNPVVNVTVNQAGAPQSCGQIVDARDGQTYNTVVIGNQCWMAQNLNIGSLIEGSGNQSNNSVIEKYCYDNNESNCNIYGGLYQWNEMMHYSTTSGVQGICPSGWHVPTDAEWCSVTNFLDATVNCSAIGWSGTDAGGKMKETGTIHWNSPNLGATNNSGFTALPGGNRSNTSGSFDYLSSNSYWWSSSLYDTSYPRIRGMVNDNAQVYRLYNHKSYGFSVRCLKN